ncbi:response regulator [Roseateles violae]|uniref:Response regulator transcription factor n=1 Tax=Roseateles violae TaxID=3058042 RepID=A0ABT8DQ39_9BURK|nr:response regulator transcription factor [Pelomonas sp. PFR6]MDN3919054.1 response regulator transcription factor [Pelomonas sp. PFR6]
MNPPEPAKAIARCLVVDDDAEIRQAVGDYLRRFGLRVWAAANGVEMRRLIGSNEFDIVVLDLMLPDEDGLSLCRWLRRDSPRLPIIMLTAQGDPISRVLGLEMGADDYLGKPFEPRELVARIKAVLRRSQPDGQGPAGGRPAETARRRLVQFEGWRFDRVLRQLRSPDDVLVMLSNAEYRLLSAFIDRPGRVLSREQLIELSRAPGVVVNDRSIDLAVSRLRQKLGDSSREPGLIRTLRGEGYLFDARVQG